MARTPSIADNAHVLSLLDEAGFNGQGPYAVSLQAAKPPYGLTVEFQNTSKPFKDVAFEENATLVLGLVSDLDHINVTFGDQSYGLAAGAASSRLGYDVKDLGRNKDTLTTYLQALHD